jgi:hypothetical protein
MSLEGIVSKRLGSRLPLGPLAPLAQVQESRRASGEAEAEEDWGR